MQPQRPHQPREPRREPTVRGQSFPGNERAYRDTGDTRWRRMGRETLTLERIAELHAAAYRAESKSERTVERHTVALLRYADWVRDALGETPTLASMMVENVRRYMGHLRTQTCWTNNRHMPQYARDRPLSDTTLNWHVRGLRAVASWLYEEGYTPTNVLARLKPPKVADYDVDILSTEEIARILRHFNHHTEVGSRDLAIFATLLDTGMRAGELAALSLDDLHLDQGYLGPGLSGRLRERTQGAPAQGGPARHQGHPLLPHALAGAGAPELR